MRIRIFGLAVITAVLPALAFATTITVLPGQSIQSAIQSAQHGDRIELAPGTYHEAIDFRGKSITVVGVHGAGATILDGAGLTTAIVTFVSQESPQAVLEGVTVRGANLASVQGGGVRCENQSSPTVRSCRFVDNVALKGGGMLIANSSPTIEHCLFQNNSALSSSGFPSNSVGGGILFYGGVLTIRDCTFRQNVGRAVDAVLGGSITIERSRFEDHAGFEAVSLRDVTPWVDDCVFARNAARGLTVSTYGDVFVRRCRFIDNAHAAQGGAALLYAGPNASNTQVIRVESCVFARNQAPLGAALWLFNNPEVGNDPPPEATALESCTFVANGAGTVLHNQGDGAWIHNSIVRGSASCYSGGPSLVVSYSDIEGGAAGIGNVDVDPLFVDVAADDVHLRVGSPCIAAGDPAGPFPADIDGNARDTGGQNEIGADERKPALEFGGELTVGATARIAIHGDPDPAPAILFLGAAAASVPGPFLLALPVVAIVLPPLPPAGFHAFTAIVPPGIQPVTVHAQAWTGADLTNGVEVDLW